MSSKISEPSGGFVLWIQIPNLDSQQLFKQAEKYNLDIRVGENFTTLGLYKDCFRINIGYPLLQGNAFEINCLKQLEKLIDILNILVIPNANFPKAGEITSIATFDRNK